MFSSRKSLDVALPMVAPAVLRRACVAVAVSMLAIAALGGCSVDPQPLDEVKKPASCPCLKSDGSASCPATHCGVRVTVDKSSCDGKVAKVEVMVGETLEPKVWRVGEPRLTCAAIAAGEEAVVQARADTPWKWKSLPLKCAKDSAGSAIEHVLECKTGG